VLVAVYAVFALSASARAGVQLVTKYHEAPLAYLLSAFAGGVYILATVGLAGRGPRFRMLAWAAVLVEMTGVLLVGTLSVAAPADFPKATVWSGYGAGYGWVPLVLPIFGLLWLRRTGRDTPDNSARD
jgi:NhaP-type Na+/H+ and K+/H+ antiporter